MFIPTNQQINITYVVDYFFFAFLSSINTIRGSFKWYKSLVKTPTTSVICTL